MEILAPNFYTLVAKWIYSSRLRSERFAGSSPAKCTLRRVGLEAAIPERVADARSTILCGNDKQ